MTKRIDQSLISTLPDEIIDAILVRLPIKEAVRTSILSRDWKFKYHNMSKLVFDKECFPSSTNEDVLVSNLVDIVDSILTLHNGAVHRFELSTELPSCSDASQWITFLSQNQIQELILRFKNSEPYQIPSCLFNCEALNYLELGPCVLKLPVSRKQLTKLTTLILSSISDPGGRLEALISRCPSLGVLSLMLNDSEPYEIPSCLFNYEALEYLELGNCVLKLPASFKEFTKVTTLKLSRVFDPDGKLEALISGCPSLMILSLVQVECLGDLNINSPNLHEFYTREIDFNLTFGRVPYLEKATFWVVDDDCRFCARDILCSLPNIQKLQLPGFTIQYCYSTVWKMEMFQLRSLYVDIHIEKDFLEVLCLIRNFPNLEELNIQVYDVTPSEDNTGDRKCNPTLTRLKTVKMADMTGTEEELHLIGYILTTAPLLETVAISINHDEIIISEVETLTKLMCHQRTSTQAKIFYKQGLVLDMDS